MTSNTTTTETATTTATSPPTTPMTPPKTVVLYHGPTCPDGFAAAWAAHRSLGDQAAYIPVQYGQVPPWQAPLAERLYILDFSYGPETLQGLAGLNGKGVTVLDHHATAQAALEPLAALKTPGLAIVFDQSKSGAMLAWEHFHPGKPAPLLIQLVQDRDLWRWALPMSRAINAFINANHRTFGVWNWLAEYLEAPAGFERAADRGAWILENQARMIEPLVARPHWIEIAGNRVPAVCSSTLQSEIGEALCERYSDAPFAAVFSTADRENEVWSLRSRGGFDVSAVAKAFGGGGLHSASGFRRARGESLSVVDVAEVVANEGMMIHETAVETL